MFRFRLFNIPIEVQPWFWVTMALIGGALNARSKEDLILLSMFMLAGFLSILVHELGHALTGRAFGAWPTITLHAFGGFASFPGFRLTRGQDFLMTAAGPGAQLLLAGLFFLLAQIPGIPRPATAYLVNWVWIISLFWAVLNLVPVIPLDGGRILASILGPRRQRLALIVSMVTAITAAVGLYYFRIGFIFPIFLGLMAFQNYQALKTFR